MKEGRLTVKMVSTNNNLADPLTKALNGEKVMQYMADTGFDVASSRANTAPTVSRTTSSQLDLKNGGSLAHTSPLN